jgi:hypothetical protein
MEQRSLCLGKCHFRSVLHSVPAVIQKPSDTTGDADKEAYQRGDTADPSHDQPPGLFRGDLDLFNVLFHLDQNFKGRQCSGE